MRAEVLPLPNEDAEAVRIRQQEWNDYYRPRSPAAQHLVTECVRATLLADHCHAAHHAALAKQVREATARWDADRDEEVARLTALLADDPATAVRLLRRSAAGCRWLIARWEELAGALKRRGSWAPAECEEATRLRGFRPEVEHLAGEIGRASCRERV